MTIDLKLVLECDDIPLSSIFTDSKYYQTQLLNQLYLSLINLYHH